MIFLQEKASRQTHTQETAKLTKKKSTGKTQMETRARKGKKPAKQIPSGI
jgi:hypothetical protein